MSNDNISENQIVKDFVENARRFCLLVENYSSFSTYHLAKRASELLPEIYRLALLLPDISPESEDAIKASVSIDDNAKISLNLGAKFGKFNVYREIYDVYMDKDLNEPLFSTIGDDIADIHRDLKDGLIAYSLHPVDAVWHWKFEFLNHWGRHLVSVLKAIHHLHSNYTLTEHKSNLDHDAT